jgi:oxygen-independent coproporphyrinogen-3 oxidase
MGSVTSRTKPDEKATQAGNYFVSNYPPFSCWTPERVHEVEAALDAPPAPGTDLGLYVHIPFCRKRCHFCYFKVYTDQNAAAIQRYTDALVREAGMYAEREVVGDRPMRFLYFGGGTPSYLSVTQLGELIHGLKRALPLDELEEVTFEAEPGTLNEQKLQAIREMGVTRLSFGVENFDDHVLEINGRAHLSEQIYTAWEAARRVGFPQINLDLIAGMLEESDQNWQRNIEKTLELDPDFVTIYQMEIPFNTTIYKEMKAAGKLVAPVADWETKRRWVKQAFAALERAGYTVTSAYTAVKDPATTRFVYRDSLWRGADMIALGVSSFGHLSRTHYQNQKSLGSYLEEVEAGRLPIQRALRVSEEEALVREVILKMKEGRLDAGDFRRKFGIELMERFRDPLERYAAEGRIEVRGDEITLERDTLLQVDSLLHGFFLPQHREVRYS